MGVLCSEPECLFVITRDANAGRLCAVCQSVQLTHERSIRFIAETFNHALLKIVPSNGRLRQYPGSFFRDLCLPRTGICSFGKEDILWASNHDGDFKRELMQSSRDHLVPSGADISTPNFDIVGRPTMPYGRQCRTADDHRNRACNSSWSAWVNNLRNGFSRRAAPSQQFVRQTSNGN